MSIDPASGFPELKIFMEDYLKKNLLPDLFYHSHLHILDVLDAAEKIFAAELQGSNLLVKTAALFHDSGFTRSYNDHEFHSTLIATEMLPDWGYNEMDISKINEMILATRLPQQPKSKQAEILCDADLDYLGRDDFESIGNLLFKELMARRMIENENQWNLLQVSFLKSHKYFTPYALKNREPLKQIHLRRLEEKIKKL